MQKKQIKMKWFYSFLFGLCAMAVLFAPVMAESFTGTFAASDTCRNLVNEGITYHLSKNLSISDSDKWRYPFTVDDAGVKSIWVRVASDSTNYQCMEQTNESGYAFACSSVPSGAYITDIYFAYTPTGFSDTLKVTFKEALSEEVIMVAEGKIKTPQAPCARNQDVRQWEGLSGTKSLVYNTSGICTGPETFKFKDNAFAIVNQANGGGLDDQLMLERFKLAVSPAGPGYGYTLTLYFDEKNQGTCVAGKTGNCKTLVFEHTVGVSESILENPTGSIGGLKTADMPLKLVWGELKPTGLNPNRTAYPDNTNFNFKLYYENTTGTKGYENSDFHFERNLSVSFGPNCDKGFNVKATPGHIGIGVVADSALDSCKSEWQLFTVQNPKMATGNYPGQGYQSINGRFAKAFTKQPEHHSDYYFGVSKCSDSSCKAAYNTDAYVYSVTVMDGSNLSKTYQSAGAEGGSTVRRFSMRAYGSNSRPFAVKSFKLNVKTPGSYKISAFMRSKTDKNSALYYVYVTIPETSSIKNCVTEGTNGYYISKWNDCLDPHKTQLMTMVPETDTSRAFIDNKSNKGITFFFDPATSYQPSYVELDTVTCRFSSLIKDGSTSGGYCNKHEIYVPPYSRLRVESATFYMDDIPDERIDHYAFSFIRPDTKNQIHLYTNIDVAPCENVSKIPDTGFSLRSPMKKAKVQEATSFVFTGNSLQIPAIGLGMETPIPIVHVYYENGSTNEKGWDLSTLGNYVGELEGGQYLPNRGNSALTGHNWSGGVFKNIGNLNLEDEIYIFANDGFKYTYSVTEKFVTNPTDVYAMFQQIGDSSITLVTCDNYNFVTDEYDRRQLVRATLTNVVAYDMGQ